MHPEYLLELPREVSRLLLDCTATRQQACVVFGDNRTFCFLLQHAVAANGVVAEFTRGILAIPGDTKNRGHHLKPPDAHGDGKSCKHNRKEWKVGSRQGKSCSDRPWARLATDL